MTDTLSPERTQLARRIIVAIPALNEAGFIADCLTSLGLDAPEMAQVVFVVADGGSSDATREIIADLARTRPNLHLIDNPARLQSAGVNAVARSALAEGRDMLVRCDAHALYPGGFVLDLAACLEASEAASVVVAMDAAGKTCFAKAAAWIVDTPLGSGGASHRGGRQSRYVDHGHHAAFDLALFREIGGYDPEFSHNEDAEFDRRLGAKGGRIWLDADVRLTYFMRDTPQGLARQYYNYGRGRMRTLMKHGDRPRLRQMLPVALLCICVLSLLAGLMIHPLGYAGLLGYGLILLCASLWMLMRTRAFCGLWAGVALGVMHLSWALGAVRMWLSARQ